MTREVFPRRIGIKFTWKLRDRQREKDMKLSRQIIHQCRSPLQRPRRKQPTIFSTQRVHYGIIYAIRNNAALLRIPAAS